MTWRDRRPAARRRAAIAAVLGLGVVAASGPLLVIPALALVALVYWAHHLVSAFAGDPEVPYPNLAFVIVVNSAIVLAVQGLLFAADIGSF